MLQRINQNVFLDPVAVMDNIGRITAHIRDSPHGDTADHLPRQFELVPIPTTDGRLYHRDVHGEYWRLWPYIDGTRTHNVTQSGRVARESGAAFGCFQKLLTDLPGPRLHDTIPDFHNTPLRFEQFHEAYDRDLFNRAGKCRNEIDFALSYESCAGGLRELQERGDSPERIVHNDAKVNNVLFDDTSMDAVCVVDLDTVMPGLALHDFGDLVRSATSPSPEDTVHVQNVAVQLDRYEQLVEGYLTTAIDFLTEAEVQNLAAAGKIITLEIGVRFLTDYLMGDTYFKTERPQQNLDRSRTQFALLASIHAHYDQLESISQSVYRRLGSQN